jgi:hypothetical protein
MLPLSARAADSVNVLDTATPDTNARTGKSPDGLLLTTKPGTLGRVLSKDKFNVPLVISARVKTDTNNIRLFYGNGEVILGWEGNPTELRYHDLRTGNENGAAGKGQIRPNQWISIRWIIDEDSTRIEVDGAERARFAGDYKGLSARVALGTFDKAKLTVQSLEVLTSARKPDKPPVALDPVTVAADVEVAARKPTGADGPEQHAPFDATQIERPTFRDRPKLLEKSLASITAMTVVGAGAADLSGQTADILAAVSAQSRQGSKAGAGFVRAEGDGTMRISFEEAVRAVTMRYPVWEPGHIDVSFGEKFGGKAGPSAGTAFALLMLSCLEGFDIDPRCAVTGDVTVDWKVRGVGGIGPKLRGAALDKCLYAAIPAADEAAFLDMGVYHGHHAWWDLQVFSIATLQEAQAVVRKDRTEKLAEAIRLFAELQPKLAQTERATLQNPDTAATLRKILDLAPNHLSAKVCLALASNQGPRTLSVSGSYYYLAAAIAPFREWFQDPDAGAATYKNVVATTRKRIDSLRPIVDKSLLPLLTEESAFVETFDGFVNGRNTAAAARSRYESLQARIASTFSDAGTLEKLLREGY